MATYKISHTSGNTDVSFEMPVRGVTYAFVVRRNAREQKWYMDILTGDDRTPVRLGIKLVANFPLLNSLWSETRPNAEFDVLDSQSKGQDPESDTDLGSRMDIFFSEFTKDFP